MQQRTIPGFEFIQLPVGSRKNILCELHAKLLYSGPAVAPCSGVCYWSYWSSRSAGPFPHLPAYTMRQIILSALMLAPFGASAQVGTVRYTHTYPVLYSHHFAYIKVTNQAVDKEFVAPATHATVSRSMVFDATASLMYPTDKPHVEPEDRRVSEGEEAIDTTYVNFGSGTYTESRVIGGVYLVGDQQPAIPWRLDGEERIYLGLRVMKATAVVDSAVVEAWFTPYRPDPGWPGSVWRAARAHLDGNQRGGWGSVRCGVP